jgi:hypothetical protein
LLLLLYSVCFASSTDAFSSTNNGLASSSDGFAPSSGFLRFCFSSSDVPFFWYHVVLMTILDYLYASSDFIIPVISSELFPVGSASSSNRDLLLLPAMISAALVRTCFFH